MQPSEGLIEYIDGKPLDTYLEELVASRAHDMRVMTDRKNKFKMPIDVRTLGNDMHRPRGDDNIRNILVSKGDLGGKRGAVNSVVIDRVTGLIAEGVNGKRDSAFIKVSDLHPELLRRRDAMQGDYEHPSKDEAGEPVREVYPHGDNPLRHAEVKAINELLTARPDADISEFQIDNSFTFKDGTDADAPCCANCSRMTLGAPAVRVGKYTHVPWDGGNRHFMDESELIDYLRRMDEKG
ncbi:YwqJ-related putative deaminase [Nocardiopsis sp. ARC36]